MFMLFYLNVAAHLDNPGRVAGSDRLFRYVPGNHGAGSDHRPLTDGYPAQHGDADTEPGMVPDPYIAFGLKRLIPDRSAGQGTVIV